VSAEPTITADQVMQIATIGPDMAERIATYAGHRAAGLRPTDARRQVDNITEETGRKYERVMRQVRAALGLPPLPTYRPTSGPNADALVAASESGNHNRWHTARGVTKPGCELCPGGRREVSR
jgi:hypothetical protein